MVQGAIVAAFTGVMVGRANNGSATALLLCSCNEPCLQLIFVFPVSLLCFNAIHVRDLVRIFLYFVFVCMYVYERERGGAHNVEHW